MMKHLPIFFAPILRISAIPAEALETFHCVFDQRCGFVSGEQEYACSATEWTETIVLDRVRDLAFLTSKSGSIELAVHDGPQAISFIVKIATGAIQAITIDHKELEAVYSRQSFLELGGGLLGAQYHGKCEVN